MAGKTVQIHFRVNESDYEHLRQTAESCGVSMSVLVRSLISGFQPKEFPKEEFHKCLNLLSVTANNINQIVARALAFGYLDVQELDEEVRELKKLRLDLMEQFLTSEEPYGSL